MDFVDDFRYYRDQRMIEEPFELDDERFDALLAATAEQLCYELKINPPEWILAVPAPRDPWFVSGMESLKSIALVESPLPFRLRKIFVLENFLNPMNTPYASSTVPFFQTPTERPRCSRYRQSGKTLSTI